MHNQHHGQIQRLVLKERSEMNNSVNWDLSSLKVGGVCYSAYTHFVQKVPKRPKFLFGLLLSYHYDFSTIGHQIRYDCLDMIMIYPSPTFNFTAWAIMLRYLSPIFSHFSLPCIEEEEEEASRLFAWTKPITHLLWLTDTCHRTSE